MSYDFDLWNGPLAEEERAQEATEAAEEEHYWPPETDELWSLVGEALSTLSWTRNLVVTEALAKDWKKLAQPTVDRLKAALDAKFEASS